MEQVTNFDVSIITTRWDARLSLMSPPSPLDGTPIQR
jgi:hypothetical protein